MNPPSHTPKSCKYVGPCVPLKCADSDYKSPMSWDGTKVYQMTIQKPESSKPEAAILKISLSSLIDAEVRTVQILITLVSGCSMETH